MQIKDALRDNRFRDVLPIEYQEEVAQFIQDPGCPCNVPLYRKILRDCKKQLRDYFPGKEISDEKEEIQRLSQNHWSVISCHIDQLEKKLRSLPPGRKQLDVARYEDQVTVVINELDIVY